MVHCAISDLPIFVENLKFVVKLKVYLMSLASWSNIGLIESKNGHNEWNGDSLDAFETTMKFHPLEWHHLFIGIILRN